MPNIAGLTRAQTRFIRQLRNSTGTFPADQWPSALVMRRWMQNQSFYAVLLELVDAINFQADLHLARANVLASNALPNSFTSPNPDVDLQGLLTTVRLSHYHRNSVRKYRREPKLWPKLDEAAFERLKRAHFRADPRWQAFEDWCAAHGAPSPMALPAPAKNTNSQGSPLPSERPCSTRPSSPKSEQASSTGNHDRLQNLSHSRGTGL